MKDTSPILLMMTPEDRSYLGKFKPLMKGRQAYFVDTMPSTGAEVELYAKSKGIKNIISTSSVVLNKWVAQPEHQKLDNWNGSLYERSGVTTLFINPLRQLYSVPYGEFLAERFISKLISPELWEKTPEFTWDLLDVETVEKWYEIFKDAIAMATDIETINYDAKITDSEEVNRFTLIRCICYTGLWKDGTIHTVVLPIREAQPALQSYYLSWMRKFDALKVPKIYQNGLYDTSHQLTYNSKPWGYYFDTQSLFHSWLSELPKRLDFIAAFCVHNIFYWKDLSTQSGKLFEYNARDGWATMCAFIYLIRNMPDWAITNYLQKFPLWVPSLVCNLEGLLVNQNTRKDLITKHIADYEAIRAKLNTWFSGNFNPHSPKQVLKLMDFYGSPDLESSDEANLKKFALRHPLNGRFAGEILKARELGKVISTYLKPAGFTIAVKQTKKPSPLLKGNILFYSLNPDGTDTGRFSCREGYSWTGAQIQNITSAIKEMIEAPPGWKLGEIDGEQAEARCVAYLSGDLNLIKTVESTDDYHKLNAARFFGLPYNEIDDPLRYLSKRINHGANYNMGWFVLLETMGEENVDRAKKLLGLPSYYKRRQVCEHLLGLYEKAYPTVKTRGYQSIKTVVGTTHKLVSPLNWTRWCFGNPANSKPILNAYIAHSPQNLSGGILNEAFKEVYWQVAYKYPNNFRLKGYIHDSLLFIIKDTEDKDKYLKLARDCCIRPKKIKDCIGIERTMLIPMAVKTGYNWKNMEKWNG